MGLVKTEFKFVFNAMRVVELVMQEAVYLATKIPIYIYKHAC